MGCNWTLTVGFLGLMLVYGGLGQPNNKTPGYLPRDCADIQNEGQFSSGVYTVYLAAARDKPIQVYCDMDTDEGGWLVFQRREDGSADFYRDWNEYQVGFGDLYTEFWLGNLYLHKLTSSGSYEMRVDMEDFDEDVKFAFYDSFSVGPPIGDYKLSVSGYAGNAGDSMDYHDGAKFSTYDRDNDSDPGNCAEHHKGAGWYKGCYHANPNGRYMEGGTNRVKGAVVWQTFRGFYYSLKFMEMKIRPQNYRK